MNDDQNVHVEGDVQGGIINIGGKLDLHGNVIIQQKALPSVLPAKPIFISYSRANREFAEQLRANLEAIGFTVWRDVHQMQVGDDWWRQITEAIDGSHTMILCMSPKALESPVVAQEWQYARQVGTRVMPVFAEDIDFATVPRWMGRADWADFRAGAKERDAVWGRFIDQLRRDYDRRRVPFMADKLPEYFVPRPDEFDSVLNALVNADGAVAITAALRGVGGFGKTTLTLALCHDVRVRGAFDDGILWVTLGEKPSEADLIRKASDLITLLTGEAPKVITREAVKAALTEAIGDRYILLVMDDLWRRHDADLFLLDRKECPNHAALITTRFDHVLPEQTRFRQNVDAMRLDQAITLLAWNIQADITPHKAALEGLAKRLGEWAVLLRLANGQLRKQIEHGKSLGDALAWVDTALTRKGLKAFDPKDPDQRTDAVSSTVRASLELLDDDTTAQFARLAVFPEDADVPFTTLERLWDLDDFDTEEAATAIHDAGLLLGFDLEARVIRLHDVIRQYLIDEHKAELQAWQAAFVDALGDPRALSNEYEWRSIAYHLLEAGQRDTLRALLLDHRFLQAKLDATDANALVSDAAMIEKGDPVMRIMRSFWQVSAHVLSTPDNHDQLYNQLIGRLGLHEEQQPEIAALLTTVRESAENHPDPQLILIKPTLEPAGGMLEAILVGHTDYIRGVLVLADGRILSWSGDKTLRLWDADGTPLAVMEGHMRAVSGASALNDGRFLSWSEDGTLRLWRADGTPLAVMEGHTGPVRSVLKTRDGRFLSWAGGIGKNHKLRLWSNDGTPLTVLEGHTDWVRGVLALDDGRFLSWSKDKTLRLWANDGAPLAVMKGRRELVEDALQWHWLPGSEVKSWMGHAGPVNGVLALDDGRFLSWSSDHTLRLWAADGTPLAALEGHTGPVSGVLVLADGRILSWSGDKTLRLWDADGTPLAVMEGHTRAVSGASALNNGRFLSWSEDGTLRLWRADGTPLAVMEGHTGPVRSVLKTRDGRFLSWASRDNTLRLWANDGALLAVLEGHTGIVWGVRELADGRFLSWSSDRTLRLWANDGAPLAVLEGHTGIVWGVRELADGHILSWAKHENTLRLWRLDGTHLTLPQSHTEQVYGVIALDDGHFLSWSEDGTLRLWRADGTPLAVMEGHTSGVRGVLKTRDDRILSWAEENKLRLWAPDGTSLNVLEGHPASVMGARALTDGRIISWDGYGIQRIWSSDGMPLGIINSGEVFWHLEYKGHQTVEDTVRPVEWETDGNTLFGFNSASGAVVCHFISDGGLGAFAQLSDGTVATGGDGGRLHFLRPNAALRRLMGLGG